MITSSYYHAKRGRKSHRNVGIFITIYKEGSVARGQSAAASRYRRLVADQTNASTTSYCLFQLRPGRDVLKRHATPRHALVHLSINQQPR